MSLSIKLGAASAVDLSGAGDLGRILIPGLSPVFQLDDLLRATGRETLANAPAGALQTSFTTDQEARWSLEGVTLTLSFEPTAAGSIAITKSGDLFSYAQGNDAMSKVSIAVPGGKAYVAISFQVGLSVAGGAAFSSGNFGVQANISNSDQFNVTNYKCFDASTPLSDAIIQAFQSFVLPFKSTGVANLNDGDYIDFDFIGKLNLGFGVNYGFSGLLLAGRSGGEISQSFSNNALGKAVFKATPTFKASAEFSVTYDHVDTFRVVIGRRGRAGGESNGASLYLFRTKKKDITTAFTAGIGLSPGASYSAAANLDSILTKAGSAVTSALPPQLASAAAPGLQAGLKTAAAVGNAFVADINSRVNALLEMADSRKIELQLQQENTAADTALFQFDFDFDQPEALNTGFAAAMEGRYADAVRIAGVSLSANSYVESLFISRSSLTLQFFDLWKFTDVIAYTSQTAITYAGAGVFRLTAKEGVMHESGKVGRTGQVEVFFTAEASEGAEVESISDLVVKLNFALADYQNGRAAQQTFRALGLLNAPGLNVDVRKMSGALAPNSVVRVTCLFNQTSFSAFQADPPKSRPAPFDQRNYNTFAAVVRSLDSSAPALFASYNNWATYNVTKNDQDGSTIPPDRTSPGDIGGSEWPGNFPSLDHAQQTIAGNYFEAGRHFMNLCADLNQLTRDIDAVSTESQYKHLLDELNDIIRHDVPVSFIKSVFIALLKVSGSVPVNQQLNGFNLSFEAVAGAANSSN